MTKCLEFYEFVEKHGKLCGMSDKEEKQAMKYWNEYRKAYEKSGGNSPLSEDAWFKQQRKTAEVAKHKSERFVGTKSAKNPPESPKEEAQVCACSSCGGTDKDAVLVSLHILRQYDAPTNLCNAIQKWIEEKYGKWN